MASLVKKIVSGGQTGADRGGLDAAIALGIPHGGWCPRGRRAEDGAIPDRYDLQETDAANYQTRTRRNVINSDGTVVFTPGAPNSGSRLTIEIAREVGKPFLHVDTKSVVAKLAEAEQRLRLWIAEHGIETLNVAGSRESKAQGLHALVTTFLKTALVGHEYEIADQELPIAAEATTEYRKRSE